MDRERVIERIKKLLKLANDSGAAPGEIENAMRMAREYMNEFSVAEAELIAGENIIRQDCQGKRGWCAWEQRLVNVVCQVCDVKAVFVHKPTGVTIQFVGYPKDIAVATELFPALLASIRACARQQTKTSAENRSFSEGFVAGLNSQLRQQRQAQAQTNALVHRKDLTIKAWMDANLALTKRRSTATAQVDSNAYARGRELGARVALKNTLE